MPLPSHSDVSLSSDGPVMAVAPLIKTARIMPAHDLLLRSVGTGANAGKPVRQGCAGRCLDDASRSGAASDDKSSRRNYPVDEPDPAAMRPMRLNRIASMPPAIASALRNHIPGVAAFDRAHHRRAVRGLGAAGDHGDAQCLPGLAADRDRAVHRRRDRRRRRGARGRDGADAAGRNAVGSAFIAAIFALPCYALLILASLVFLD